METAQFNGLLRRLVRERAGRSPEPSACVLGFQSIKTSANVHRIGRGIDAGKKIAGRKGHLGLDALGPLLAAWVTAAGVSDNAGTASTCSRRSPPPIPASASHRTLRRR